MVPEDTIGRLELPLPPELASAGKARLAVRQAALRWGIGEPANSSAALLVTELVTNAVLHAGTPLAVTVRLLGRGLRIEVQDGDRRLPVVGAERPEELLATRSMTGRGLALIAALSDRWGADPAKTGKVMWAEVGTGRRLVAEASPVHASQPAGSLVGRAANIESATRSVLVGAVAAASRAGVFAQAQTGATASRAVAHARGGTGATSLVHLTGVPVRVLVESVRQYADVHREAILCELDSGGGEVPEALIEVGREMSAGALDLGRAGIGAAAAAMARGEELVDFDLAVSGRDLKSLEWLGAGFKRLVTSVLGGRLLTAPASEEVVAYRSWFREEIVSQLAGNPAKPCSVGAGSGSLRAAGS